MPNQPVPAAELYARLQPQLWRILSTQLQIGEEVLEDACQTAWFLLLVLRNSIEPGSELGWLSTTATRQALRTQRRQLESEAYNEDAQLIELTRYRPLEPGPERAVEDRQRLAEITVLPVRQRQLIWLHGIGYDYREIAAATGASRRTVERQLLRARKRLLEGQCGAEGEGEEATG